jgi:hypothetical protein
LISSHLITLSTQEGTMARYGFDYSRDQRYNGSERGRGYEPRTYRIDVGYDAGGQYRGSGASGDYYGVESVYRRGNRGAPPQRYGAEYGRTRRTGGRYAGYPGGWGGFYGAGYGVDFDAGRGGTYGGDYGFGRGRREAYTGGAYSRGRSRWSR